ncbi:antitoxin Xre/MbcA/ParS toxin-binding domain-containing protein [Allohahella marinimesophila]|uniref:Antitoxin Xre/MbcA/ParS-like toxin-binding domain-containing protein n=1 Tax=Allohahella marinimesophila TaxID=1054972 RepID=A0ABP7PZ78_9GAMM
MLANNDGSAIYGLSASIFTSPKSYIEAVRQGLPGCTVKAAVDDFGDRDLFVRILNTTAPNLHRFYSKKSLGREASEELLDAFRLILEATSVWGSKSAAKQWLSSPVPALDGERPIDLFDTFEGRRWVTGVLRHIETGDFS